MKYHSKTLAYSLWHIFRIEDKKSAEVFLCDGNRANDYLTGVNVSPN